MPRVDAAGRIAEHLARVRHPLVLLVAPYGSESTSLINQAAQRTGTHFTPCPTAPVAGRALQRRLSVLDHAPGISVHEAAHRMLVPAGAGSSAPPASPSRAGQVLFINNIELLDQESSAVLDVLMREQRVGLIMSCASESRLGFRYSKALHGPRGLKLELPELSQDEQHSLLEETLGAPPTSVLANFLCATGGSAPEGLVTVASLGLEEQWIGTRATHSAIRYVPSWMDGRSAAGVLTGLEQDLGSAAVAILQHVAIQEEVPLRDLTTDPETRDAVFWMIDAGLLKVTNSQVQLAWPLFRHALVLADSMPRPAKEASAGGTASWALHRLANGHELDATATVAAAAAHLEKGLLEQARFIASSLPEDDPRRHCIAASAMTAAGASRSALEILSHAPGCPDAAVLRDFISAGLLFSSDPTDETLGDVSARLHLFSDYEPDRYLKTFAAPEASGAEAASPGRGLHDYQPPVTELVDVGRFICSSRAALDAYAASLGDDVERAHSSWLAAVQTPAAQLPIVAAGWLIERIGMAKLIYDPGAELYPPGWFEGETPERRLRYALIIETQSLLRELVCGVETDKLRPAMEDLWEQFETGLPLGSASRRFLEALDYAIGGTRMAELKGPAQLLAPGLTSTFRDATTDAVLLFARLLHAPDSALPRMLEKAFQNTARTPGTRRITMRCLLLRRAAQMPPELLELTINYARRAHVKEEILQAAAQLGGEENVRRRVLDSTVPGLGGLRFCSGPPVQPAGQHSPSEASAAKLLSAREREVARHLMLGAGAAHVARDLQISVRTVQTHVRNIYRKLEVTSRTQLHARLAAPSAAAAEVSGVEIPSAAAVPAPRSSASPIDPPVNTSRAVR